MKMKIILSIGFLIGSFYNANGQITHVSDEAEPKFDFSLDIKNMHLWRGYQVTSGAMTGASVFFQSGGNKNFKAGFWGGAGFDGKYKEVCFFINYKINGFFIDYLDSFNWTGYEETADIFSYNRNSTRHFIDVTLGYNFVDIPLRAAISTVVQGRDIYIGSNGKIQNRFSNYAELKYTAWSSEDTNLKVFAGGAFSAVDKTTFYSSKANFVNIGIECNKTLQINNFKLPLTATFRINPEQKNGALEVAAHIF